MFAIKMIVDNIAVFSKYMYSDPSLYRASPIAVSLLRGIFYSAFFTVNPDWLRGFTVV